ncbi:hypothetical protein CTZ27_11400 [Streptomyces griseocarneus]|nr:hypothetical protein CTZ27_11400 [Streptomyces griseocarneus]
MTVADTASGGTAWRGDFTEPHRRVPDAGPLRRRPLYHACRSAAPAVATGLTLTRGTVRHPVPERTLSALHRAVAAAPVRPVRSVATGSRGVR